jgi:methyltransferase (TIGR00027 family)
MEPGRASITAMATAMMRAEHTRTAAEPLIDDPWGERLVPDTVRVRLPDLRSHPSYGAIIIRARFAEDALAAAIQRGVGQYVILGAGLDSFALRRPAYARGVQVFEIDHPDTQNFKLSRLADCGLPKPADVHFIGADLGVEGAEEALGRSPFDRA